MAEKKINGQTYKVDPLPASTVVVLYTDVMKVATKATGRTAALLMALGGDEDSIDVSTDMAALAGLSDILKTTDGVEVLDLLKRLMEGVSVKRPSGYAPIDFDEEFTGKLAALPPVARFAAEVQFRDFFTASVGSGIRAALKKAFLQ